MGEFITDFVGADPVGPIVRDLVDNWETDTVRRHLLLRLWRSPHGEVYDEDLEDLDRPLSHLGSPIHLRERVVAYAGLVDVAITQLRSPMKTLIITEKDEKRHNNLIALQGLWLQTPELRKAVQVALDATKAPIQWFNYQVVAYKILCATGGWVGRAKGGHYLTQLIPDVDVAEIRRQAHLVQNYAYGRGKLAYSNEFANAMLALYNLEVRPEVEPLKDLFALSSEQLVALGQSWMARDESIFLGKEESETAPPSPPSEPAPRETVRPGGLVVVTSAR